MNSKRIKLMVIVLLLVCSAISQARIKLVAPKANADKIDIADLTYPGKASASMPTRFGSRPSTIQRR